VGEAAVKVIKAAGVHATVELSSSRMHGDYIGVLIGEVILLWVAVVAISMEWDALLSFAVLCKVPLAVHLLSRRVGSWLEDKREES